MTNTIIDWTRVCSSLNIVAILNGTRETIPAKMISERPCLRRPYSEISSPSQIANIVPPVIAMIIVIVGRFQPSVKVSGLDPAVNWLKMILICPKPFNAAIGTAR